MPKFKDIKPYVINKAEDGKTAEVNLYGEIVESVPTDFWTGEKVDGLFIELAGFLEELDTLKEMDEITFRINSVGGQVDAGIAIYNRIWELDAKTTTIVDGLAASAASIVAQAGDTRKVMMGTQTMIHCASALLWGYYNVSDMNEVVNMLDSTDKRIAEVLSARTGRDEAEIRRMMKKTTWMTAKEAYENGFADEIIGQTEPEVDEVKDSNIYIVNGIPHMLRGIQPPTMNVKNIIAPAQFNLKSSGTGPSDNKNTKTEVKRMELQELKEQQPELVNQIQAEATAAAQAENEAAVKNAVEAERKRIKEIESIENMVVDKALLNDAKYEHPIDAKELALKAMQAQAAAGAQFVADRSVEIANSGANDVTADPNVGSDLETETKDIADGAALIAAAMGAKKEV